MTTSRTTTAGATTPVPFDPECAAALAVVGEQLPPSLTADMIPVMRQAMTSGEGVMAEPSDDDLRRGGTFAVEERAVPGPDGAPDVSLLICRPTAFPHAVPAIFHIHGGGMVFGTNRSGVPEMLDWAEDLGLAVVSVEYRLAPETQHPGPVEDCYAGLLWTVEHAAELGIDPSRVVVAGASAGGGLAAAVALLCRDRGMPALFGQMLIYPMLDDRNDTHSAHQMAGLGVWDRAANETGWTALLGEARGGPDVSPYAAPARAEDLGNLPPTFIDCASAETFRDEDVEYATRIWQAGGDAELHVWPGGFHGFDAMAPQAAISQAARTARLVWMARLLG